MTGSGSLETLQPVEPLREHFLVSDEPSLLTFGGR
jgi:hypothetical protein